MTLRSIAAGSLAFLLLFAVPAAAQLPGFTLSKQWTIERVGENHWKLTGAVEIEREGTKFFADEMEVFTDTNKLTGSGNVVFISATSRIAADRMEFDTRTQMGTFYNASGTAALGDQVERSMFGTQEPDAYFYGQTLEKLGPKRYRITDGGFTTCLQPTPRWEITSSTVVVNLDDYAILRNSILRVKGVPLFYLPVFYYPIQSDDRATGFLIPTYGNSTYRGQSLSNAFFWAISRSQDATFVHDWFSRTGQGTGVEHRYIASPGSEGSSRFYMLREHESLVAGGDGTQAIPGRQSYDIKANATQVLPARLRLRANIDYFTDVTTQQLYQQSIYDASRRWRNYGANVAGSWGGYSLNGTFDVREAFQGESSSSLYGGAPRVALNFAPRKLGPTPIYVAFGSEYVRLLRQDKSASGIVDQGLSRMDWTPSVRVPLTTWPFLTVQSSATWHNTYYTESLVEKIQTDEPLYRRYFDFQTEIIGPTFVRIWDTPSNGYAEKYKHVIEPAITFQRISAIEEASRIVPLESGDYAIGDTTRIQYGLTNRFLARRNERGKTAAREFLSVSLNQTYYTDPFASQVDYQYTTSFHGRDPSSYSPVSLNVRAAMTEQLDGTLRIEYDPIEGGLQSVGANGTVGVSDKWQSRIGWSKRKLISSLDGDNFFNADTTVRTAGNRLGGAYSFNYNLARQEFLQQRFTAYYNAQCCGVALEYQAFNYPTDFGSRFFIPQDRRFNISFTLAGVGTFSNFLGALGGAQR